MNSFMNRQANLKGLCYFSNFKQRSFKNAIEHIKWYLLLFFYVDSFCLRLGRIFFSWKQLKGWWESDQYSKLTKSSDCDYRVFHFQKSLHYQEWCSKMQFLIRSSPDLLGFKTHNLQPNPCQLCTMGLELQHYRMLSSTA